jgi:hypothetical protein
VSGTVHVRTQAGLAARRNFGQGHGLPATPEAVNQHQLLVVVI